LYDNKLFVTNTNSDSVSAIDVRSGKLDYTFSLFPAVLYGSQPNDIDFLLDGRLRREPRR
jgi:hypothetical protein